MPTIGVEKAFRDQDRAARAAREHQRSVVRSRASADLPEVEGRATCVVCGDDVPLADTMATATGPACLACHFGADEAPAVDRELLGTGGSTLAYALMVASPFLGAWAGASDPQVGRLGMMVVFFGSTVGLYLTLRWMRHLRDGWVGLREASAAVEDGSEPTGASRWLGWGKVVLSGFMMGAVGATTASIWLLIGLAATGFFG